MLISYGHGTDSIEKTIGTLKSAGVTKLKDVRSARSSEHNPQFYQEAMEEWLPEAGIEYSWDERLGGHRKATKGNPNTGWRVRGFKNYAPHMWSKEFLTAIDDLTDEAEGEIIAFMCAESLWWSCHRRMIADFLQVARDVPVTHLMHDRKLQPHDPYLNDTGIRLMDNGLLIYDHGQQLLTA